jgi:hypothetical protein
VTFLQHLARPDITTSECGNQAEGDAGDCTHHEATRDDAPVSWKAHRLERVHKSRRNSPDESVVEGSRQPTRDNQSNNGGNQTEQGAFGQELPNDVGSTGAQRESDGHLHPTGMSAGQHQVRDVGACNQRDEHDSNEQGSPHELRLQRQ